MYKPKLVLFDFGGTLCNDGPFLLEEGMEQLRLAADNPEVTTTEAMAKIWRELDEAIMTKRIVGDGGYVIDVLLESMLRNIFVRLGLKYSISMVECEAIFDRNNCKRNATPHIIELMDALHKAGIRTAIISNTVISSEGMRVTVNEHVPNNQMEFIITSSEYLMCKPAVDMFEAAAKIAGLSPSECWYCGNDFKADVGGAHASGMLPIYYNVDSDIPFAKLEVNGKPYYQMNDWAELVAKIPTL